METNLNMLFIDLLPSYGFILNAVNENQSITKDEFINLLKSVYDTREPRHNIFLNAIERSKFETIKRKNGSAIFNA